ncbi:histidine kinase [Chryseobacterium angstadtii]|uniref:Histidine kinase n=1 Tax=Chryseobacterium angstadtii TaxID=558151 RepID=A0A0J7IAL9_9FLAO|nr:FecR domain-containing protein [Chryseobacterium angstadtii]KMQ62954.1 histidine kinase [Chryseobacterium angstadtii]
MKYFIKNSKYKNPAAFVFKLWQREVSEEEISEKENRVLNQWKNQAEKDLDKVHMQESKERVLSALELYFISPVKITPINQFKRYIYTAAAAVILLLSVGGILTYQALFKPDIYTAVSGNRKINLADGSVVTLLKGAELTVEKSFPASTRVVDLKGDAVFSVAKSKIHPFIVRADGFSTRVLGTIFKISQSGKDKSVHLYEGKVAVSYTGAGVSYLKPNQKWTNFGIAHTAAVISVNPEKNAGKQSTELISLSFNDVSFKEVAEVMQTNYKIKILYPKETAEKKITADFTGGTADENMEALAFILGLEVHKENHIYTLKK